MNKAIEIGAEILLTIFDDKFFVLIPYPENIIEKDSEKIEMLLYKEKPDHNHIVKLDNTIYLKINSQATFWKYAKMKVKLKNWINIYKWHFTKERVEKWVDVRIALDMVRDSRDWKIVDKQAKNNYKN